MGWLILALLAGATLAALLWWARPARSAIEMVVAMLLLAVAGYAWQGRPALPGKPTPPHVASAARDSLFAAERGQWLDKLGRDAQALDTADAFIRKGDTAYAIGVLRGELSRRPNSATLWIGLGNALVAHADGAVTPPARFAFVRAATLNPANPAAAYFLGLDYAVSGDLDRAAQLWRDIVIRAPADAPWRLAVAEKLILLEQLRGGAPAAR